MDQETLVAEQIQAGREFLERFQQHHPVSAAVWLKPVEAQWYLYVASPDITDRTKRAVYATVLQVVRSMTNSFDPFRVRLINHDDVLVRDVMDLHSLYPNGIPAWHQPLLLGARGIEEAYFYPLVPATTMAASKP